MRRTAAGIARSQAGLRAGRTREVREVHGVVVGLCLRGSRVRWSDELVIVETARVTDIDSRERRPQAQSCFRSTRRKRSVLPIIGTAVAALNAGVAVRTAGVRVRSGVIVVHRVGMAVVVSVDGAVIVIDRVIVVIDSV